MCSRGSGSGTRRSGAWSARRRSGREASVELPGRDDVRLGGSPGRCGRDVALPALEVRGDLTEDPAVALPLERLHDEAPAGPEGLAGEGERGLPKVEGAGQDHGPRAAEAGGRGRSGGGP